jgi:hypothetical protein
MSISTRHWRRGRTAPRNKVVWRQVLGARGIGATIGFFLAIFVARIQTPRCGCAPESQVRNRLPAGEGRIRTLGPPVMYGGSGRRVPALIAVFEVAGTAVALQGGTKVVRPDRHPEFR